MSLRKVILSLGATALLAGTGFLLALAAEFVAAVVAYLVGDPTVQDPVSTILVFGILATICYTLLFRGDDK